MKKKIRPSIVIFKYLTKLKKLLKKKLVELIFVKRVDNINKKVKITEEYTINSWKKIEKISTEDSFICAWGVKLKTWANTLISFNWKITICC